MGKSPERSKLSESGPFLYNVAFRRDVTRRKSRKWHQQDVKIYQKVGNVERRGLQFTLQSVTIIVDYCKNYSYFCKLFYIINKLFLQAIYVQVAKTTIRMLNYCT